uniref:Macro domain-containing protein n=1 Tax=Acanthochromis polyacanthus TaxID=80966 RepID=A0A3Q1FGL7_9TELE
MAGTSSTSKRNINKLSRGERQAIHSGAILELSFFNLMYLYIPTYNSLLHSLEDMRSNCIQNGVLKLSMPHIGCGLDQLKWTEVAKILEQLFIGTSSTITIYSLLWTAASMN